MKTKQKGFTLIEMVVVLVLVGILGAVAAARFQDLSVEAANSAIRGAAAEISAGGAINAANRLASNFTQGQAFTVAGTACATYANAITVAAGSTADIDADATGDSDLYVQPDAAVVDCTNGQATNPLPTCNLRHKKSAINDVNFIVYCVD